MRKTLIALIAIASATNAFAAGESPAYNPIEPKGYVPMTTAATVSEDTAFLSSNPYPGDPRDFNIRLSERRRSYDVQGGSVGTGGL